MKYSQNIDKPSTLVKFLQGLPNLCFDHGIEDVIICPGSRSAPLTIAFAKNQLINKYVINDERSAAYIALGISIQKRKTVALICTSGTAALNFAPAVAEAFYLNAQLLILTADRPPEWINQNDGQSIQQRDLYEPNIKKSYELPVDISHNDSLWQAEKILNDAINNTKTIPLGPVHINIPLREPLYDIENSTIYKIRNINILQSKNNISITDWDSVIELLLKYPKRLVIAGQMNVNLERRQYLSNFFEKSKTPFIADINSNLNDCANSIQFSDGILSNITVDEINKIKPDLIITFGGDFISKSLKNIFRSYQPTVHIHLNNNDNYSDTFQNITHLIKISPEIFFSEINNKVALSYDKNNLDHWNELSIKVKNGINNFLKNNDFNEIYAVQEIAKLLPKNSILHSSNSLAIRYLSLLSFNKLPIHCNRGTSGIDGCTSTALGAALSTDKICTLITGDMAFFYDRNAFWHNYIPKNLRIIILNNLGGNIFRAIDGPSKQPEIEEYFVTKQQYTARNLANEYNFEYTFINNFQKFNDCLKSFFKTSNNARIMELSFDGKQSNDNLAKMKNLIKIELERQIQ